MFAILNNLLNTTRCGELLNSEMNTYSLIIHKSLNSVIMSLTRGQSAWVKSPSETQRSAFSSGCVLSDSANFSSWLVGVMDGDGTFYFTETNKGMWSFSFQISQSTYNLRLLYFIKSKLKIGFVTIDSKNSMAVYRVRNKKHILKYIIPIFDAHLLLTSKHFKYNLFKEAILISNNSMLSVEEKNLLISNLKFKSKKLPKNYVSPAWSVTLNSLSCKEDAIKVVNKSWLIGFTESEGSFYLVEKSPTRLVHAFEITQKLDFIVLKAIALIFDLTVTKKQTYSTVVTTNQKSIKIIANYFFKNMKGMKSLEYRIWERSFNKRKKGFEYLSNIRDLMRKIKSIRFDKNHKKI